MGSSLERAQALKASLVDFVLDAEGEVATALEEYSVERLMQLSKLQNQNRQQLVIDLFLVEGGVGDRTPIDCFIAEQSDLSESDRQLLQQWQHSFVGLFAVERVEGDRFHLMNWLTAQHYTVVSDGSQSSEVLARLQEGEILIALISRFTESEWLFTSPLILLGKLGKPKLAVAVGNFKDQFNRHLYGDAPGLLEEAWRSVEVYHQEFIDFFGGDEVTLSGYQLEKRFQDFQKQLTQRHLEAAGLDSSKSLDDLVKDANISEDELAEAAEVLGADQKTVSEALKAPTKMMPTQVGLPPELKRAEQVTVITHPRWGQTFSTRYTRMQELLQNQSLWDEKTPQWVEKFAQDPYTTSYVWYRLAEQYPTALEALLQQVVAPTFSIDQDLPRFLKQHHQPIEPILPEIASVPIHLHNLFQDALTEVQKTKSKSTPKAKTGMGFKR